jgi:hypothetical protein
MVMPEEYIRAKMLAKRERMILRRIGPTSGSRSFSASSRWRRRLDPEEGDHWQPEDRPPVADEEIGDEDEETRMRRDRLAHVLDQRDHLRDEVHHQEDGDGDHDGAHEGGIHHELLGLGRELILPLEVLGDALQHLGQPARVLPRLDQAAEHPAEHLRVARQGAGQVLPALDVLDESGDHLAEAGVLHAIAQVGEALDERHAGTGKLLEVEAEVDQVGALDCAPEAARALGRPAHHEVEPHTLQTELEVDDVQGVDLAQDGLALWVDRLVVEVRHAAWR